MFQKCILGLQTEPKEYQLSIFVPKVSDCIFLTH